MTRAGVTGAVLLLTIALPCFLTLPWSVSRYDVQRSGEAGKVLAGPSLAEPLGTDDLGRSVLWRSLLGGAVSLGIGISAAALAVGIGVAWGATAGYAGGRTDALMMRVVDVLYGLPYILLVVMINLALFPYLLQVLSLLLPSGGGADAAARLLTLLIAIGGVSWLTMARVIRGQVLSLREQPFLEATRALGMGRWRVLTRHLLPNLVGPIVVYAALAVPAAILQESFLSFLGHRGAAAAAELGQPGDARGGGAAGPGAAAGAVPVVAARRAVRAAGGDADVVELPGRRAAGAVGPEGALAAKDAKSAKEVGNRRIEYGVRVRVRVRWAPIPSP